MGLNKQDVGLERAEAVLPCSHGGSKKLEKMRREHLRTPEEFFNWCSGRKSSVFFFTELFAESLHRSAVCWCRAVLPAADLVDLQV